MALDRLGQFAVLAVLALHVDQQQRVGGRQQEQHREEQAEDDAGHDQNQVEDRREQLAA